jgi:N-dimethylarginine dimethylaminohydrolase
MKDGLKMTVKTDARILMCRPEHFGVVYAINPWMKPEDWEHDERALAEQSHREWDGLRQTLSFLGATIELVPAVAGVPDLVFTANAAVVLDRKALLARFRYPQRREEESHYKAAFRALQAKGIIDAIHTFPDGMTHEGAGDCVFDQTRNLFWMGYGPRSDIATRATLEDIFDVEALPLKLADPRFYHMDTALSALPNGEVMYVPEAFTPEGRALIADRVNAAQRIKLGMDDACAFAANTVCIGNALVMPGCGPVLRADLEGRGYKVVTVPLGSFQRSGGAAFCLTLRLDRQSANVAQPLLTAAMR